MDERAMRLAREGTLLRYCAALERGDLETVASVLEAAETDPVLDQKIQELHQAYQEELEEAERSSSESVLRELLQRHLPSGFGPADEPEIPSLTVRDVLARMQSDGALRGDLSQEPGASLHLLRETDAPVPEALSARGMRQLFERLGVKVSERFQGLFRETAIFLAMGQHQNAARLAAARRQRERRAPTDPGREEEQG